MQKILLVEDREDDLLLIRRAFARSGVGTPLVTARDGERALACLEEMAGDAGTAPDLPSVVLLDLKLPRVSGLEVLERVRAHPRLRRLPVVVLTSSREEEDIRGAYDRGANSYLLKPPGPDDLNRLVRMVDDYWATLNIVADETLQDRTVA